MREHRDRPRRSMLYIPGANERALEKAKTLPADALIFDLEDSVAPDAKKDARARAVEKAKAGGYGKREIIIRVNGFATPWGHYDIAAAAQSGADGILLPKVEGAGVVRQVVSLLDVYGAPETMRVWCMLETPLGILHAERIAGASPRLGGFIMGTSDLAKDLHARHTRMRLPMLTSVELCLLAARGYGLAIIDGVQLDLEDEEAFVDACNQGMELGFDGKTLIHPKQIGPANRIFAPTASEVDYSRRIIAAHTEATARGRGVIVVDGRLVENLHVEAARRTLALHDAIAEMEAEFALAHAAQ